MDANIAQVVRVPAAAPPGPLGDGLWAPALALAGGAGAAFLAARAAAGGPGEPCSN